MSRLWSQSSWAINKLHYRAVKLVNLWCSEVFVISTARASAVLSIHCVLNFISIRKLLGNMLRLPKWCFRQSAPVCSRCLMGKPFPYVCALFIKVYSLDVWRCWAYFINSLGVFFCNPSSCIYEMLLTVLNSSVTVSLLLRVLWRLQVAGCRREEAR